MNRAQRNQLYNNKAEGKFTIWFSLFIQCIYTQRRCCKLVSQSYCTLTLLVDMYGLWTTHINRSMPMRLRTRLLSSYIAIAPL